MDIAIKHPVLYVAIYKTDRPSCNDQHWTFLIGPSIETAESEGVRCGVELHLDSNGWPTWDYTQTIVPLWGEDDLLTRIMVAEIADLAPLGAIMRDQEVTPMTERAGTMVGDLELSSFTWVWGKMEMLERKPECFAGECTALRMFEQAGYRLVVDWCQSAVDELVERVRMRGCRKRKRRLSAIGMKTLNFVYGWKQPVDDGADPLVNPNVERGDSSTISRSDQIVTGVLGAAALEMRQRVAERKRREMTGEQERGASVKPKGSENALSSAQRTKSEHVNEVEGVAENRSEKEATASLESPRVPTTNLVVPRKPEEATGEKKIAKDEEEDENTDQDKEARVTNTAAVKIIEPNKPGDATEGKKVVTQDEEDEDETESEDEDEEDEDEDEDEEEDEEESDATDDNDEDDDNGKDEPKGMAGGSTKEKKANARPDGVRGTSVHFAELYKPEMAIEGEKNIAKEDGDEPESEEDESADEDEDEEEEDDEEESEDSDSDNEEDEEDDYSDNDSDDDEEGEEEHAAAHTTLKKIPAITLSA